MNINLKQVLKEKISLNKVLILYSFHYNFAAIQEYEINNPIRKEEYQYLRRYGYIDETESFITEKGLKFLYKLTNENVLQKIVKENNQKLDWIEEWREMFPKGVKSGGYPIKSNLFDCNKKMKGFLKKHEYDKEKIFAATKKYIQEMEMKGYQYMKTATYFIEKDNQSTLADYCENLEDLDNRITNIKMI